MNSTMKQNDLRNSGSWDCGPTILVVDTSIDEYRYWAEWHDATVLLARTVPEAIQLLRTSSVDTCILNLSLGQHDPGAMLHNLHSVAPGLNIVATVDDYDIRLEQIAWTHGTTAFVVKPEHLSWLDCWLEASHFNKQTYSQTTPLGAPEIQPLEQLMFS